MERGFDCIIIGGGPIGIACALAAKARNLSYIIIEKGSLVNSLYNYPVNMTFFSTSEKLEIGNVPFVSNNNKPTRQEALEYYRRVAQAASLHIKLFEEVISIEKTATGFEVHSRKSRYAAANIIIATGFYNIPFLLKVKGEDLPKLTHYYKDPHPYAFRNVLVIGANNSAVDAALETFRKGAKVTMVIRKDKIGERVKYWVRPDIENRIKAGEIKAYFNSTVKEIRAAEVLIETPEGMVVIPNDDVIAMTGYEPDLDFLSRTGIAISSDENKTPTYNDETHETNIIGIYIAGVICGGMDTHSWFIENSRDHAIKIMDDIAAKKITNAP